MNHLLHQFRKDWAEFRWWIIGLWVLCAAYGAFIWHTLSTITKLIEFYQNPPIWYILADFVPMLAAAVLAARIIWADHPVATDAFWRTRPVSRIQVALEKSLLLLFAIVLPWSLIALVRPAWFDMPRRELLEVWGIRYFVLAGFGWFLFWIIGFSNRIRITLALVTGMLVLIQFDLWQHLSRLPSLFSAPFTIALNFLHYYKLVGWFSEANFPIPAGMITDFLSLLIVAVVHYKYSRVWKSFLTAIVVYALFANYSRWPASAVSTRELAGMPDLRAEITAAAITETMVHPQSQQNVTQSLRLTVEVSPMADPLFADVVEFQSEVFLESDENRLSKRQKFTPSWDRGSYGMRELVRKREGQTPFSPASQLHFNAPAPGNAVQFDPSDSIFIHLGNQARVRVGELKELMRVPLEPGKVGHGRGYAWAIDTSKTTDRLEVIRHSKQSEWPLDWQLGLPQNLKQWPRKDPWQNSWRPGTGMDFETREFGMHQLEASVIDRSTKKYPEKSYAGGGRGGDYWSRECFTLREGAANLRQTNRSPIDWSETDLIIYEADDLGSAWIPLHMDPKLSLKFPRKRPEI